MTASTASTEITKPYGKDHKGAVAPKDDAVLVSFKIPGDNDTANAAEKAKITASVDATVATIKAAQTAHPDLRIEQSGEGSSEDEFMAIFNSDLQKAGTTSLPITLLILLIAFGAIVAAGIPLLLAITGVIGTMGLVGPLSQLTPVDDVDQPRHPADRARRRRRLLAVLPAPRARRARSRPQQPGGDRSCRRDVRSRRADLRDHGHDRDGRDVLRRSVDVHVVRDRDDRRRRRGDDRIAHGAARDAVAVR